MGKIQIITDSMTDVPKEIVEKYNIIVVPLTIIFGEEEYRDGVDLSHADFYNKLSAAKELPKTSQVTPATFASVFQQALGEGKEILCINGSSRASGTHQSAIIAKEELESDLIDVVDTMGLSFGGGILVYEAAKMAEEGRERREIVEALEKLKLRVDHIFTVDTLEYLKKGGRLNPMKATIGTLLNIKPILTVDAGLVEQLDKVRGSKKAVGKMIELAKERGGDLRNKTVAIAHANDLDALENLRAKVVEEFQPKEVIIAEVGCTIGTHAGPGMVALFYYRSE